jgi:hypothetical protein
MIETSLNRRYYDAHSIRLLRYDHCRIICENLRSVLTFFTLFMYIMAISVFDILKLALALPVYIVGSVLIRLIHTTETHAFFKQKMEHRLSFRHQQTDAVPVLPRIGTKVGFSTWCV